MSTIERHHFHSFSSSCPLDKDSRLFDIPQIWTIENKFWEKTFQFQALGMETCFWHLTVGGHCLSKRFYARSLKRGKSSTKIDTLVPDVTPRTLCCCTGLLFASLVVWVLNENFISIPRQVIEYRGATWCEKEWMGERNPKKCRRCVSKAIK